jgi:phage gpG-like protein
MDMNVQFNGADDTRYGIKRIGDSIPKSNYTAVVEVCSLVETRAKTHHLTGATLNYRTHRLQQSVKSIVYPAYSFVRGRVGSPVVYAAIHEFGGVIRPKKAKFLSFQIDGKWIRTKQVTMPKRPWLMNSLEDVKPQIESIFGRQVEIVING